MNDDEEAEPCVKPERTKIGQREDRTDLDVVEGRFVGDVIEQKQSWWTRRKDEISHTHIKC